VHGGKALTSEIAGQGAGGRSRERRTLRRISEEKYAVALASRRKRAGERGIGEYEQGKKKVFLFEKEKRQQVMFRYRLKGTFGFGGGRREGGEIMKWRRRMMRENGLVSDCCPGGGRGSSGWKFRVAGGE